MKKQAAVSFQQTILIILPFPLARTNAAPLVGTCPYGLLVLKSLHFTLWKECDFITQPMAGPGKATVTVDSLVMSARVWGETVLEAQRAPMTLIQFSHGIESQRSKTFSALTGGDEATYCALGIKINESLMASAFPDRAVVICAPRSSTVLAQCNDTINYLAACHKCPDDSFGNRVSVLQGSWFVITHMLGGETGSAHAPAVDLCHHVSSCFSFWGRPRLIRLSYSYNYFCPAPFLMPLPVSPSCSPSPGRAGASIPEDVTPHYLSPAMPHLGVGNYLRLNTIFQIKPRN